MLEKIHEHIYGLVKVGEEEKGRSDWNFGLISLYVPSSMDRVSRCKQWCKNELARL